MSKVTGVVHKVNERDGKGKGGRPWVNRSLEIDGEWYGGFVDEAKLPGLDAVMEGDLVELEYTENGKFKNITSVKVLQEVPKVVNTAAVTPSAAPKPLVTERDVRIMFAGNLKVSAEVANTLLGAGALTLGTQKNKQVTNYLAYVCKIASDLTNEAFKFTLTQEEEQENDDESDLSE